MEMPKSTQEDIRRLKASNKNNSNSYNNYINYKNSEDGEDSKKKKKWNPAHNIYCWIHGYCWHTGKQCFVKRDGHHNSATLANKKGGSTSKYLDT